MDTNRINFPKLDNDWDVSIYNLKRIKESMEYFLNEASYIASGNEISLQQLLFVYRQIAFNLVILENEFSEHMDKDIQFKINKKHELEFTNLIDNEITIPFSSLMDNDTTDSFLYAF